VLLAVGWQYIGATTCVVTLCKWFEHFIGLAIVAKGRPRPPELQRKTCMKHEKNQFNIGL